MFSSCPPACVYYKARALRYIEIATFPWTNIMRVIWDDIVEWNTPCMLCHKSLAAFHPGTKFFFSLLIKMCWNVEVNLKFDNLSTNVKLFRRINNIFLHRHCKHFPHFIFYIECSHFSYILVYINQLILITIFSFVFILLRKQSIDEMNIVRIRFWERAYCYAVSLSP